MFFINLSHRERAGEGEGEGDYEEVLVRQE